MDRGDDWLIVTGFSSTLIPSFAESWLFQSEDQNMKQSFMCLWFPSFQTNQGGRNDTGNHQILHYLKIGCHL